jgi:UDP-glucose 4-epimerase
MNFVVIGGAGFLGSVITSELTESKNPVVVFDDLSTGHIKDVHPGASLVVGTLLDATQINSVLNGADVVIHCGFKTSVEQAHNSQELVWYNNYIGTTNLVNAMILNNVKKLVISSTCEVYDNTNTKALLEHDATNPLTIYGVTMKSVEEMFDHITKTRGINTTILRYFNISGAYKSEILGWIYDRNKYSKDIILKIIKNIKKNKLNLEVITGFKKTKDKTQVVDFLHVSDVAKAHILAALQPQENVLEIINLGNNEKNTILEIINKIEKECGIELQKTLKKEKQIESSFLISSNEKAFNLLNWKPQKNITDIIQSLFFCLNVKIKKKQPPKGKPKWFNFKEIPELVKDK